MMERLPHLIIFLGVFLTALASVDAEVKSVFVFGDSQFDAGNNQYLKDCKLKANFKPYGSSFFNHPTGRFTNGRTVADFIAQYLEIEFQKPYQEVYRLLAKDSRMPFPSNGLNFASAGSGLLPDTNKKAGVTSIQVQLQQFEAQLAKPPHLENSTHQHIHLKQINESLFFLVSGGNDVFSYFLLPGASNMTMETYVDAMLKEVDRFITKIYMNGGRRIVLFSLGPIGCIPGRVLIRGTPTDRCLDKMDEMAVYFNAGLKRFAYSIPSKYPGAIGLYAAVYVTGQKYRDNAKEYGFTNINDACCGNGPLNGGWQCGIFGYKMCKNPNEYFFWDFFHPSERTYELIAKAFWAGDKDEISPINLKTLVHIYNKTLPIH
ncbi:putative GDSL lipase/esterase, SGNH hydrolase superfamily [Helianthus annuus]|nr:putative GDSL lipase/esterase, SGNH hydrolase superfamily [Helianthus annuus]